MANKVKSKSQFKRLKAQGVDPDFMVCGKCNSTRYDVPCAYPLENCPIERDKQLEKQ